jgi:hypothetical protein
VYALGERYTKKLLAKIASLELAIFIWRAQMDWDRVMSGTEEYSCEPLTVEGYKRTLQNPGTVYRAMQLGSIAKLDIVDVIKLYPEHFSKLTRFADRQGIPLEELFDWITDYISWSESEDFIDR